MMTPEVEAEIMRQLSEALVGRYAWRGPQAKVRVVTTIVVTLADALTSAAPENPERIGTDDATGAPVFQWQVSGTYLRGAIAAAIRGAVEAAVEVGDLIAVMEA